MLRRREAMKFGAGIWLFGQFVDRYAADAYGPEVSTLEAIARAGEVGAIEVLDINYPFSDPDITVDEVRDALGVVVDLGHSLFAKETPADVLQLVHEHGRLFTIEVNDNWREWDDDMAVGSVHLIETLEFFLAVRKIGWDQPILLDQFPFRED